MHFDDNDTNADTYYYQVTAINTIVGGECESAPAMSADGIHDYVTAHTDGVEEMDGGIKVYPNPTQGILFVETRFIASQPSAYCITNTMGQTLMTDQITCETQQIDVSNLPQGIYFIAIDGVTRKFLVK